MSKRHFHARLCAALGFVLAALAGEAPAQDLQATLQVEVSTNEESVRSQQRVSQLADQAQDLLAEYRAVVRETESLRVYNEHLQRVVTDQKNEAESIDRQLEGLEETNRGIVPLMVEMVDMLERIVGADIPFRLDERRQRAVRLRAMLDEAEVTTSEKYRRIMEAYSNELEFGRTTEAYSGALPNRGQTVNFLRVGRTLLMYQTSDQSETGWFNPRTRQFEVLPDRYRPDVRRGLAIARNEKPPDLVVLPVPGPEEVR
jgi:regulator of replication initiation timing